MTPVRSEKLAQQAKYGRVRILEVILMPGKVVVVSIQSGTKTIKRLLRALVKEGVVSDQKADELERLVDHEDQSCCQKVS